MFIDASALVAIATLEPDRVDFYNKIKASAERIISPIVIYETTLAVARRNSCSIDDAREVVNTLVKLFDCRMVNIDAEISRLALDAFNRFGKGRHPARLNLGDCFAYACAKAHGVPILCKGDGFRQTDARLA